MGARMWTGAAVVGLALAASACANGIGGGGGGGGEVPREAPGAQPLAPAGGSDAATSSGDVSSGPGLNVRPTVIKTADLSLEVAHDGFRDALRTATAVAGRYGGFVVSTTVHGIDATTGEVVLRVPAERFEAALADIHELGKVKAEEVAGQEVGQEFVDLEARRRNLAAQEDVLLDLMARARDIGDSIRVERELTGVQLEIERIEGRLRFLRDQTDLGTITLSLAEVGVVPHEPGILERAWETAKNAFLAVVSGLLLVVAVAVAVAIPVGGAVLLGLVAWRRLRPRPA